MSSRKSRHWKDIFTLLSHQLFYLSCEKKRRNQRTINTYYAHTIIWCGEKWWRTEWGGGGGGASGPKPPGLKEISKSFKGKIGHNPLMSPPTTPTQCPPQKKKKKKKKKSLLVSLFQRDVFFFFACKLSSDRTWGPFFFCLSVLHPWLCTTPFRFLFRWFFHSMLGITWKKGHWIC